MKDRKPYDLKNFLAIYNIGQVLACTCFAVNVSEKWRIFH